MRVSIACGLVLGIFFASGATFAADGKRAARPGWVDGTIDEKYTELRYLTAVGSGNSRDAAEADAKKQLAGVFRSKVTSDTTTESKSTMTEDTSARTEGSASGSMKSSVNIQTSLELRGVEIKSHYQDPKTSEHYALAVMDKLKAKNSYNIELSNLKAKILALYERYEANPDVAAANEILQLTEKYENLNTEFEFLNSGKGAALPLTFQQIDKIKAGMNELKTTMAVALEFSGEEVAPEFQEMITSCLSDKGIAVAAKVEGGKAPAYHVQYNMTEKQKFMDVKGWVKYQFSSLAVIKKGNVLLDRKRFSKEATGRDKDNAFDSVKEELSEQVCAQIAKTVTQR